jgi:hypothetical protein
VAVKVLLWLLREFNLKIGVQDFNTFANLPKLLILSGMPSGEILMFQRLKISPFGLPDRLAKVLKIYLGLLI